MSDSRQSSSNTDFAFWMRTGLRRQSLPAAEVEAKFNPWHDPQNGQFTYRQSGRYFGGGGATVTWLAKPKLQPRRLSSAGR